MQPKCIDTVGDDFSHLLECLRCTGFHRPCGSTGGDYASFGSGGDCLYFERTVKGLSYRIHCRCRAATAESLGCVGAELAENLKEPGGTVREQVEVLLDENLLAAELAADKASWKLLFGKANNSASGDKAASQMSVGAVVVSPSGRYIAYTVDITGYETYALYVRDTQGPRKSVAEEWLQSGTDGRVVWATDERVLFYCKFDEQHRPSELWRHDRMLPPGRRKDMLVHREKDQLFSLYMKKSTDERFLIMLLESGQSSEAWLMSLGADSEPKPEIYGLGQLRLVGARRPRVEYDVDVRGETVYILTNLDAPNFRVMQARLPPPQDSVPDTHGADPAWQQLQCVQGLSACQQQHGNAFAPSETVTVSGIHAFADHLVLEGRDSTGLTRVWTLQLINPIDGATILSMRPTTYDHAKAKVAAIHELVVGREELATLTLDWLQQYDADAVRLVYSSLVTPEQTLDAVWPRQEPDEAVAAVGGLGSGYPRHTAVQRLVKELPAPGYDASQYHSWRLWATADDGTKVPLSCVCRIKPAEASSQPGPLLLYGYGSYGLTTEPEFRTTKQRLPLLDRGITLCLAHVRGGGELGRQAWYEVGGKYLAKRNTFTDFIAATKELIAQGLTEPSMLAIEGRSAGGLLVGAVINMAPELFTAALAGVPFTDVLTTMRDATIPLTVGEWEEWGNPNQARYFDYIESYSPIDNVPEGERALQLPALLATAGLYDPRVAYWEPTKWLQTLRHHRRDAVQQSSVFRQLSAEHSGPILEDEAGLLCNAEAGMAPLLLKMDLDAGHFSASDRYALLRELAVGCEYLSPPPRTSTTTA